MDKGKRKTITNDKLELKNVNQWKDRTDNKTIYQQEHEKEPMKTRQEYIT